MQAEVITLDADAYFYSRERRNSLVAQAIDSSAAVVWTTDLEGVISTCEGGGLLDIGASPGRCVGMNIHSWEQIPFERALSELKAGAPARKYVVSGIGPRYPEEQGKVETVEGPWLLSLSFLRSPAGRPIGVACVSIPLAGAEPLSTFTACPMGACLIEGRHHE